MFQLLGDFVRGLTGWRRFVFAFTAGVLSALAFAPADLFALLLLGFAAVIALLDGAARGPRPVRTFALVGWAFGFGQFLAGLYWIVYPFLVDATAHAWQIPFAITILPAGLALFPALACAACAFAWRPGPSRVLVFAAFYSIGEYLRGHILTGFPWNLPGYGWGASLGVLQSASVWGVYGLSLLTVMLGAALALAFERGRAWRWAAVAVGLGAVVWLAGLARLGETPTRDVPGVQLRLVQPDVPQDQKYLPQYRYRNWQRLIDLSRAPAAIRPTVIVWPEAAPPFLLDRAPWALGDIARLTAGKTVLITGAARAQAMPDAPPRFFNSVFIFARGGERLATYDKFHLVPFGEYLPLRGLFAALGIEKLVDMPGSFSAGDGPHSFAVPGAPHVGPLICYEVIFPGAVVGSQRPGWFVNVTDDSWFGPPGSSGPHQHLLIARVRAIEEGLPIARAANTGISAIVDPLGRITARMASGRLGVVDGPLPAGLKATIYSRFGDSLFFLLLVACGIIAYIDARAVRHHAGK